MKKIIVGSRDSKLAVAQTKLVIERLKKYNELAIEIKTFRTSGDMLSTQSVDQVTTKGLFVKELDEALREKKIDLAVHSLKDMPMEVAEDLPIVALMKRGDPRDVAVFRKGVYDGRNHFTAMKVGTSSVRRSIQFMSLYHEAKVEAVRGNVLTRLKKLESGQYDALILAAAGLKRLGLEDRIGMYFDVDEIMPAAGQGILAVQARKGMDVSFLNEINEEDTMVVAKAERAYVKELNGGCESPVAAYGEIKNNKLYLSGLFYREDTDQFYKETVIGSKDDPEAFGRDFAAYMRRRYRN